MKLSVKKLSKRTTIILASSGVVLLAVGGTAAYAAQSNALPGSPMYPLKQAWESVALFVSPSPVAKAETHLNIAQNRITALQQTTTTAPTTPVQVIQQAQDHLQTALDEANKISDSAKKQEVKADIAKEVTKAKTELEAETETETKTTATNGDSSSSQSNSTTTAEVKAQNTQLQAAVSKDD